VIDAVTAKDDILALQLTENLQRGPRSDRYGPGGGRIFSGPAWAGRAGCGRNHQYDDQPGKGAGDNGERGLDQRNVDRHHPPADQIWNLGEEDGGVVGQPPWPLRQFINAFLDRSR
jgi:hypothetical protein